MENLRNNDDTADSDANASISLLQRYAQPAVPTQNEVQYAQIIRPQPQPQPQPAAIANEEQFDFRLQTPLKAFDDNASINSDASKMNGQILSSGSSISSGYVDLTVPPNNSNNRAQRRVIRPTSPETSF